jgi:hypothetical protein
LQKFIQELESKTSLGTNTIQEHLEERELEKLSSISNFCVGKDYLKI